LKRNFDFFWFFKAAKKKKKKTKSKKLFKRKKKKRRRKNRFKMKTALKKRRAQTGGGGGGGGGGKFDGRPKGKSKGAPHRKSSGQRPPYESSTSRVEPDVFIFFTYITYIHLFTLSIFNLIVLASRNSASNIQTLCSLPRHHHRRNIEQTTFS
jgi:hypothetical protein